MKHFITLAFVFSFATAQAQLASPNKDGLTYGHVHLNVTNIETHTAIWQEHFNGELIQRGPLTGIKLPNMVILFTERTPTMRSQDTLMDHFGVKVRDIDSFIERWEASGLEMGRVFTGAEGQTNAYVTLPDGVYVELQEDQSLHQEITGYHIHFYSQESEALLQWYSDLLGSEIKPRGSISTTTNVPGINLSFSNSRDPRLPTEGSAIDHIGFEVQNLEAFCRQLEERGIQFDMPYREIPAIGLAIAFITDPQGVRIEFTEGLMDY
jgi:catechol 2,3-dioxygenase-like lactoylglutathione lyase family enzyme